MRLASLAIVPLCLRMICVNMCLAMSSPFLPVEATRKGLSSLQFCLFFAMFNLTEIIFAITWMALVRRKTVSCRLLYNAGTYCVGAFTILIGLMNFMDDYFFESVIILRVLLGINSSAFNIGFFALLHYQFPTKVGYAFGILETTTSVCYAIFQPLASVLHGLGGIHYPFIIFGCLLVIVCLLTQPFVPTIPTVPISVVSQRSLLKIPPFWTALFLILLTQTFYVFITVLLSYNVVIMLKAPHIAAAFLFSMNKLAFIASSIIIGIILDRMGCIELTIMIAFVFNFIALLLWTSPKFLPNEPSVPQVYVLGLMAGLANGMLMTGSFTMLKDNASAYCEENNAHAQNMVTSCYFIFVHTGCFAGAILAGSLENAYGLERAAEMMMSLCAFIIFGSSPFILDASRAFVRNRRPISDHLLSTSPTKQRMPKLYDDANKELLTTLPVYKLKLENVVNNTWTVKSSGLEEATAVSDRGFKMSDTFKREAEYSDNIKDLNTAAIHAVEKSTNSEDTVDLKKIIVDNSESNSSQVIGVSSNTELNTTLSEESRIRDVEEVLRFITDAQETNVTTDLEGGSESNRSITDLHSDEKTDK